MNRLFATIKAESASVFFIGISATVIGLAVQFGTSGQITPFMSLAAGGLAATAAAFHISCLHKRYKSLSK